MNEQFPANPTEPLDLESYQQPAAGAAAANQDIINQNERLGSIDLIEDYDFQHLAVQGLIDEQAASIAARDEAAAAVPYEEIARQSLAAEHALPQLYGQIEGLGERAAKITRSAAEAARLAPRASEAAKQLEATMLGGLEAEEVSLREKIAAAGETIVGIALYGQPWPVPRAAQHEIAPEPKTEPQEPAALAAAAEATPQGAAPTKQAAMTPPTAGTPGRRSVPAKKTAAKATAPKAAVKAAPAKSPDARTEVFSKEQADAAVGLLTEVIGFAVSRGAFKMEEMRKDLPVVQRMNPDEYRDFKYRFSSLKEDAISLLKSQGKAAHWLEIGKARGMRHQLTVRDNDSGEVQPAKKARKAQPAKKAPAKKAPSNR